MESHPLLRQAWRLTAADFDLHPVWIYVHLMDMQEPWYESTDEATVRPWTGPLPAALQRGNLLARAQFTLADGRRFGGYGTPSETGEIGQMQPGLFGKRKGSKRHAFWGGMPGISAAERKAFFRAVAGNPRTVFPIRFEIEPGLVQGAVTTGVIEGFYRLGDEVRIETGSEPEPEPARPLTPEELDQEERRAMFRLLTTGQAEEALAIAKTRVDAAPQDAKHWSDLASVLSHSGNQTEATRAATQAIICEPGNVDHYSAACRCYLKTEAWEECLATAERRRRLDIPRQIRMMMLDELNLFGARALFAMGRYDEALAWLKEVTPVYQAMGFPHDPLMTAGGLAKACRAAGKTK